jgi:mannitol/fructose-specific phosphotransferase system IIA component (Ntr-type)
MGILTDSLLPKDIRLDLRASDPRDAFEEVLSSLRSDSRVRDWEKLRSSLHENRPTEALREPPGTMCLHHGRTESVSGLVLAAGRSAEGMTLPGSQTRIHLVFIAAIPEALSNEYLRILGAISRVCREPASLEELRTAPDAGAFLSMLERGCRA